MPFSDDELMQIYGDLTPTINADPVPPPVEDQTTPFRRLKEVGNILPKAVNSFIDSGISIGQAMQQSPDSNADLEGYKNPLPTFDTGQTHGLVDFALDKAAPEIASWMIPYAGVSKVAKAAGLGSALVEGLGQGAANFMSSAKDAPDPGVSGAVGLASGALQAGLPRWTRAIPLAVASSVEGFAHDNWVGAGLNFGLNMLPGVHVGAGGIPDITSPQLNPSKLGQLDLPSILDSINPEQQSSLIRRASPSEQGGQFSFMDDVSAVPRQPSPEVQPELFNSTMALGDSRPLATQLDLHDVQPSGLNLSPDKVSDLSFAPAPIEPQEASGLHLDMAPTPTVQTESPLIRLQSEGRLNPDAPTFTLHSPARVEAPDPTGDLFNWRNKAVNRQPETPLLQWNEPEPPPKNTTPSDVAPTPSSPVEPPAKVPTVEVPDATGEKEPSPKLSKKEQLKQTAKAEKFAKGEPYVARGNDFATDGEYEVHLPNGVQKTMYRDPESGWWYRGFDEGEPNQHFTERTLGFTKKEAIEKLSKDYGTPKEAPAVKKALPAAGAKGVGPEVMSPDGTLAPMPPRQQGPHIISTVLDEGDGVYLSGNKWNSPHMKGGDNIFAANIDSASGLGKSAFLIQDEAGAIRVTGDRAEAAKIAEMAGQRAPDKVGRGGLQSEDLIDPVTKPEPATVDQHRVAESVKDSAELESAKKVQAKIEELQQELKFAKDMGDDLAQRGITAAIGKMKKGLQTTGAVTPETLGIIAVAGVGGLVAYQQSKGDIGTTIAGAVIGMGLAIGGVKVFKDFKGIVGPELKAPDVKVPSEKITEKMTRLATETQHTKAGLAVGGRGGVVANMLLGAEDMFGLNRQEWYRDLKVKAGGFIDEILHDQTKALKDVAKVKPSDSFADATSRYLRGQLSDPAEVQKLLDSGGIVSTDDGAWSRLPKAEKAKYPEKWIQLEDQNNTNTRGDGVKVWQVTNSVKQQLVANEKQALTLLASTPEDLKFAEYAFKTRQNLDILQQTIHAAAGPKEGRRLIGTMGQYMARSHALITDPKFYPDDVAIQGAMDKLASYKTDSFLSSVESGVHAPLPGTTGVNIRIGKSNYIVSREAAAMYDNLYSPESLRATVAQTIKEIKSYSKGMKDGTLSNADASLTGGLFQGRKEMDVAAQALMGTHTAPHEMIRATMNKLLPAAHSAHEMLNLTLAKEANGLAGRFASEIEYNQELRGLKDQLPLTTDPRMQRVIQGKINDLSNYIPISNDSPAMGLFQGSFVSRHVYSQMDDIMNPFGAMEKYMGTGLKNFNSAFKETHLIWNPVIQTRNMVQIPFFLVMGRAAHDLGAIQTAFQVVFKDSSSEIGKWAVRNGAMSGNPVKGEFNFNMHELLNGTADNQILSTFQKTRQFLHLAYSKPDDFVRTATFIAAARREAARLGVAEDVMHLDSNVTDAAREFMNRRTMDYSNVPKWVRVGRQIPLVSPFLTYSHEIVRITKNMAIDSAKGDLVSAAGLAGLSIMPFLAQSQAEAALSPQDQKDWAKGQRVGQDYARPRFRIPMSRNSDGSFNYYDISSIMPFGDYLMMGRALAHKDVSSALAVNPIAGSEKSPLLDMAAAQITGRDIHTQRDFRDSWDRAKNVLQALVPPPTPGLGQDAARDYPQELGGSIGETNAKTGRTYTIQGAIMRNLVGIDESQIKPDMAVNTMIKIGQHDIATERQYLNDTLNSKGISDDAKQRAMNRYTESVRAIMDQIQSRLNPPQ